MPRLSYRRSNLPLMTDPLAAEARRLRTDEQLSVREIRARLGIGRHRPTTVRRNTGDGYRGCLTVEVPRSRQMYWKIEGIMAGMGDGVRAEGR
jgi:hypothetical protein